jgi:hypothetical protein
MIGDTLIKYWKKTFFTEPILLAFFIVCFIVGTIYHRKQKERFFFLLYFFVGIALLLINSPLLFRRIYHGRTLVIHLEIGNTFFELTEFVALYIFFSRTLRKTRFQKMSRIFLITFCVIIIAVSKFFYSVSLISFFVIANDMLRDQSTYYHILFACHFLLLTVVLLSLLNALLCKDRITT